MREAAWCAFQSWERPANPVPHEIPLMHLKDYAIAPMARAPHNQWHRDCAPVPSPYMRSCFAAWLLDMRGEGWAFSLVRLTLLPPGSQLEFHVDESPYPADGYRLHLPLATHPSCTLDWRVGGRVHSRHLPLDGGPALVRVDVPHRATNPSGEWRIHLLAAIAAWPPALRWMGDSLQPVVGDDS